MFQQGSKLFYNVTKSLKPINNVKMLSLLSRTHLVAASNISIKSRAVRVGPMTQHLFCSTHDSQYWDYSEQHGPGVWEKKWRVCKNQSPVHVVTEAAIYDPTLKPFQLNKSLVPVRVFNNGVNLSFCPVVEPKQILLSDGPLKQSYQLAEFHFHWGDVNSCGSEHSLDGKKFAAELHIVHWNCALYEAKEKALSSTNGIAVVGVFLDAHESHDCHASFNALLKMAANVPYKNDTFSSSTFTPYALLPENTEQFFTYPGSLTTPPLTENVTWTLFRVPLKISVLQLEKLNQFKAVSENEKDKYHTVDYFPRCDGKIPQPPNISNNFRPIQPLHDRIIRASFKTK